jgi:hypothetical protein
VITTSYGFKANICSVGKDVSIHVDDFIPVLFVTVRLIDNRIQVAGTGYSLKYLLDWAA